MLESELLKQNNSEEKENFLSVGKSIIAKTADLFSDADFSVCLKNQDELRRFLNEFFYSSLKEKKAKIVKEINLWPLSIEESLGERIVSGDGLFSFVDHRIAKISPKDDYDGFNVKIYEMIGRSTFKEIFLGFKKSLSEISLSESQIKKFCRNKDVLEGENKKTLFLLAGGGRCHVVSVSNHDGLLASYHDLDDYNSLCEDNHYQVVIKIS